MSKAAAICLLAEARSSGRTLGTNPDSSRSDSSYKDFISYEDLLTKNFKAESEIRGLKAENNRFKKAKGSLHRVDNLIERNKALQRKIKNLEQEFQHREDQLKSVIKELEMGFASYRAIDTRVLDMQKQCSEMNEKMQAAVIEKDATLKITNYLYGYVGRLEAKLANQS